MDKKIIKTCPSYIIPATYYENIVYIKENYKQIDGVEILFFYMDKESKALFKNELNDILKAKVSNNREIFYTVHLPDNILEVDIDYLLEIDPFIEHYIIHPPVSEDIYEYLKFLEKLILKFGNRFCIENLIKRDFYEVIKNFKNIHVCIDVGHSIMKGEDPVELLDKFKNKIKEIHMHGIKNINGKKIDHKAFTKKSETINKAINFIKNNIINKKEKVFINFEVFSIDDLSICIDNF